MLGSSLHLDYPVATIVALNPVFLPDLLEWNFTISSLFFDTIDLNPLGTEDPQSQALVYFLMGDKNK